MANCESCNARNGHHHSRGCEFLKKKLLEKGITFDEASLDFKQHPQDPGHRISLMPGRHGG